MLTLSTPHNLPVRGVALAPGGAVLAATDGGLYAGDPAAGEWASVTGGNTAGPIAQHPDGRLVACRLGPDRVAVADLPARSRVVSLGHPWTADAAPTRLAFGPDGAELWAEYDRRVRWAVGGWRELAAEPAERPWLAVRGPGGRSADFTAMWGRLMIRAAGGRLVVREARRRPAVTAAVYTPDGRTLFVAQKSRVRVFDADTGAERPTLMWGAGRVLSLAVAADGLTAAAGTNTGRVLVWDVG